MNEMNEKMMLFTNEEFGSVRSLKIEGEPWFVGKDVANILGYQNGSRDINRHVDDEDRQKTMIFDGKQNKESIIINESGVYSLIFGSKLPSAKRFKHWVTSEVLPSIRKNEGYIIGQETLSDEELMAKGLLVAQKKIEERDAIIAKQNQKIEEDKPKVDFADHVSETDKLITVGTFAKILSNNGFETGSKRLFSYLREHKLLMKNNLPYQVHIKAGYYKVREVWKKTRYGGKVFSTTFITGKGQLWLYRKIMEEQRKAEKNQKAEIKEPSNL